MRAILAFPLWCAALGFIAVMALALCGAAGMVRLIDEIEGP